MIVQPSLSHLSVLHLEVPKLVPTGEATVNTAPFTKNPGPVNQPDPNATTLDFFSLFWEPSFFDRLKVWMLAEPKTGYISNFEAQLRLLVNAHDDNHTLKLQD